jgi:hypothetical protein
VGFRVLPIKDKELFLRYAIPCGEVLVNRGELKAGLLKKVTEAVENGQEVDAPVEDIFRVASRMCTIIAKRMGKTEIDEEVIRRYFLIEHEKAIRWRKLVRPDISVKDCKVYPAKVLKIDGNGALVRTPVGGKRLKDGFEKDLKKGDWVSAHYDYIPEKLKPEYVRRMQKK